MTAGAAVTPLTFADIPKPRIPTADEMRPSAEAWWSVLGPCAYDQWPDDLRALSSPTKMIPVPAELCGGIVEWFYSHGERPRPDGLMDLVAAIDDAMDWRDHFVRLNSRSPKDATAPGLPITCSGRQAISWFAVSERCFDDMCLFQYLPPERGRAFVLVRENAAYWDLTEIRAFIKNGRVVASTVYHYNDAKVLAAWVKGGVAVEAHESAMASFLVDKVIPACHLDTFVADIALSRMGHKLQLIEINPYGRSDPCLFGNYLAVEQWAGGLKKVADVDTPRFDRGDEDGFGHDPNDGDPSCDETQPTPTVQP